MHEQEIPKKLCTGPCGQEYNATTEFFHQNRNGLHPRCKKCRSEEAKTRNNRQEVKKHRSEQEKAYRNSPEGQEHERARKKEYHSRAEVKERRSAYHKVYHSRPEVKKNLRIKRQEHHSRPETQKKIRTQRQEYNSRPEVQERKRLYRKSYGSRLGIPEHKLAIARAYKNRHEIQDRYRTYQSNRHARKKAVSGTYTTQQIQAQLKRQKHKCYYCQARLKKTKGRYIYHIEHTFPISRVAGSDIPANSIDYIVLSCPHCNMSKGDKFPWEWPEGGRLL